LQQQLHYEQQYVDTININNYNNNNDNNNNNNDNDNEYHQDRILFQSGYFGYLGYELGQDIYPQLKQSSPSSNDNNNENDKGEDQHQYRKDYPESVLLYPTRYLVYDHLYDILHLIAFEEQEQEDSSSSLLLSSYNTIPMIQQRLQKKINEFAMKIDDYFLHLLQTAG
jgi:anthranilate/para-aminobenzoate synthase component I